MKWLSEEHIHLGRRLNSRTKNNALFFIIQLRPRQVIKRIWFRYVRCANFPIIKWASIRDFLLEEGRQETFLTSGWGSILINCGYMTGPCTGPVSLAKGWVKQGKCNIGKGDAKHLSRCMHNQDLV